MFHNKDGKDYGTNLDGLHVFTIEEAQKAVSHDPASLPLLKSEVDKLSIRAVDMQYLDGQPLYSHLTYVIQIDGHWNGNDIYFKCADGKTYNYDDAERYIYVEAMNIAASNSTCKAWSVDYLDTIARRTFQSHNINTRKMITGPGIKYKKPRKPRPTTGKSRKNCLGCGKIVWEYDPYSGAYCDRFCEP